jgi:hypothetical protein
LREILEPPPPAGSVGKSLILVLFVSIILTIFSIIHYIIEKILPFLNLRKFFI